MESYLIPRALWDEMEQIADILDKEHTEALIFLIRDLDFLDLLNDQISLGCTDDGDLCIDWPNYSLYFNADILDGGYIEYTIHDPRVGNHIKTRSLKEAINILINSLNVHVNKDDVYDQYRKDKRTPENVEDMMVLFMDPYHP